MPAREACCKCACLHGFLSLLLISVCKLSAFNGTRGPLGEQGSYFLNITKTLITLEQINKRLGFLVVTMLLF